MSRLPNPIFSNGEWYCFTFKKKENGEFVCQYVAESGDCVYTKTGFNLKQTILSMELDYLEDID